MDLAIQSWAHLSAKRRKEFKNVEEKDEIPSTGISWLFVKYIGNRK